MKPNKLRRHLETSHPGHVKKPLDFFKRKFDEYRNQENRMAHDKIHIPNPRPTTRSIFQTPGPREDPYSKPQAHEKIHIPNPRPTTRSIFQTPGPRQDPYWDVGVHQ
ncbi:hypothetical protein NHX12_013149 [Muraenolepis orangiensis]|uniref:Uncharacterized protein n=1 Tax=Muraenolepis orangiensis TaxID=630683 RepID=A0A9Q0DFM5_9TELE|nr:hypothetical protein NHX12_013149 [Muraenolepis orangiensis]